MNIAPRGGACWASIPMPEKSLSGEILAHPRNKVGVRQCHANAMYHMPRILWRPTKSTQAHVAVKDTTPGEAVKINRTNAHELLHAGWFVLLLLCNAVRGETIAAEDIMHDIGAISAMSSDSQAMGRVGEVITRTWQTADKASETANHPFPVVSESFGREVPRNIVVLSARDLLALYVDLRAGGALRVEQKWVDFYQITL